MSCSRAGSRGLGFPSGMDVVAAIVVAAAEEGELERSPRCSGTVVGGMSPLCSRCRCGFERGEGDGGCGEGGVGLGGQSRNCHCDDFAGWETSSQPAPDPVSVAV